jgi:hypothetical protein
VPIALHNATLASNCILALPHAFPGTYSVAEGTPNLWLISKIFAPDSVFGRDPAESSEVNGVH